jgi:hypothetical protein
MAESGVVAGFWPRPVTPGVAGSSPVHYASQKPLQLVELQGLFTFWLGFLSPPQDLILFTSRVSRWRVVVVARACASKRFDEDPKRAHRADCASVASSCAGSSAHNESLERAMKPRVGQCVCSEHNIEPTSNMSGSRIVDTTSSRKLQLLSKHRYTLDRIASMEQPIRMCSTGDSSSRMHSPFDGPHRSLRSTCAALPRVPISMQRIAKTPATCIAIDAERLVASSPIAHR